MVLGKSFETREHKMKQNEQTKKAEEKIKSPHRWIWKPRGRGTSRQAAVCLQELGSPLCRLWKSKYSGKLSDFPPHSPHLSSPDFCRTHVPNSRVLTWLRYLGDRIVLKPRNKFQGSPPNLKAYRASLPF